jgi:DNA-binding LytR/AlgR family response regulator
MPQLLKYLIIDDDGLDRQIVEDELSRFITFTKIAACCNALEAIELIRKFNVDVVFSDIEMPQVSGLQLLKTLPEPHPLFVFITSHPEFALQGFEENAFDYLIKPIHPHRLESCIKRINDFFHLRHKACSFDQANEMHQIIIKQGYDKYKVDINDILYLEAMKDYTRVVTVAKAYLVLEPLGNMQQKLSSPKFVRVHRSYVVNTKAIAAYKDNKAILSNAETIPVGKMYRNFLCEIFQ